jgi:hypothetical protein
MKLYIHARSNWGDGDEDYGYNISLHPSSRGRPVSETGLSHTFIVSQYCQKCEATGVIPPKMQGDKDRYLSGICPDCQGDTTLEMERLSSSAFTEKYSKWFEVEDDSWSGSV